METGNDTGYIILGIAVFVVFGGLIGWVIYRHIKYTIAGTKAQAKVVKEAFAQAGEELRVANERKKQGLGWTVPQEMVDQRMANMSGKEEIVFGYNEEEMREERKEHAKKGIAAGIVLLVFAALCVLGGVLSNRSSAKVSTYPTVQARVLRCQEITSTDDDGDEVVDHYNVDFEYTVDGETYKNTGRHSDIRLEGDITVYYNPDKPDKAYFEAYAQGEGNAFWYAIAGIVALLGIGVILGEIKNKRKLQEDH